MNTFGQLFRLTTFGESHGEAIGGVIDGMPAGIPIDVDFIQQELARRRPGQSHITTSRQEQDQILTLLNIVRATIVAEAVRQPASLSAAVWLERWPNWPCANWAYAFMPTPHRWETLLSRATTRNTTCIRLRATLYAVRMPQRLSK